MNTGQKIAVIGGGPAGLTAAYILSRNNFDVTVFEADPRYLGGISRTENYKGYCFDIGGHRFFSKSQEVEDLWTEILGDDMLTRPRKSRIFYKRKFYSYPLKPMEALFNLGFFESFLCVISYFRAQLFPVKGPKNFEDWVRNKFGKRLFNIFFKTYTEKVWGMSCKEISADWASQRIKGLSLYAAVVNALFGRKKDKTIKTLIDTFRYPRKGPGMMWERCGEKIVAQGGRILPGKAVTALNYVSSKWELACGPESFSGFDHLVSSMPLRELVRRIVPALPKNILEAADGLKYRDFLTVTLILKDKKIFDDNWVYIHDPSVKVGRIQNFKAWSPDMVPDPSMCCYGLEYFCFEGDRLWSMPDDHLLDLARTELEKIGIAKKEEVIDGCVVRQKKAYPVYDEHYLQNIETIKQGLSRFKGLHLTGRNGMHKYNNQDHSMMTAMLAAKNIMAGETVYNLWNVNQDAEYLEEVADGKHIAAGRNMPEKL